MSVTPEYIAADTQYVASPIVLTGGIAGSGAIPIVKITDPAITGITATVNSVTGASDGQRFASYGPLPGGTLISNQVAQYPFANQSIAANAIISQPLNISMYMLAPAGNVLGVTHRQTAMIALQGALSQHNNLGGTYSVITPSFIYVGCLMLAMRDISGGESLQAQYRWELDFFQPLVSLAAADKAYNGMMQSIANGTPIGSVPTYSTGLPVGNPQSVAFKNLSQ